ncbi:MAG: CPBP family intramembrane glutamic endopeptidase [Candidatus Hydrogenedentes bacterium]|nr:CPBP family intramembrane glutamic endopeptidase [Candidatus Hydrogenedentota bacterium]
MPLRNNMVWFIGAYVAIVLAVDTLAVMPDARQFGVNWRIFHWRADGLLAQFDYFKFVFWLVVPLVWCAAMARVARKYAPEAAQENMRWDWAYFGFSRWKRSDIHLLSVLTILGAISVLAILFIPALREYYPSSRELPWDTKLRHLRQFLLWNISWLPAWEFMLRYFLLRPFAERWPRFGWLVVPVFEGVYHLQKHPLEALLMFGAGLVFTAWVVRRKNLMLPLIVHGSVEVGLMAFLVLV